MSKHGSTVKITLELNQETNMDELMAHLCLMQNNIPANRESDDFLVDFSVHEGEIEPTSNFNLTNSLNIS